MSAGREESDPDDKCLAQFGEYPRGRPRPI